MEAGHAGEWAPVFFPFLDVAFAMGRATYGRVIIRPIRHPAAMKAPERPREIAARVINIRGAASLSVIETQPDARNAAIAAEGDAFYFDWCSYFTERKPRFVIGHVDARTRGHDKVWAPALGFVKSFCVRVSHFNTGEPLHMFLAEIARHNDARRMTVPMRQRNPIHLICEQRGRLHRFLEWDCVGVIVNTPETNPCRMGKRYRRIEQLVYRYPFPDGVAD